MFHYCVAHARPSIASQVVESLKSERITVPSDLAFLSDDDIDGICKDSHEDCKPVLQTVVGKARAAKSGWSDLRTRRVWVTPPVPQSQRAEVIPLHVPLLSSAAAKSSSAGTQSGPSSSSMQLQKRVQKLINAQSLQPPKGQDAKSSEVALVDRDNHLI